MWDHYNLNCGPLSNQKTLFVTTGIYYCAAGQNFSGCFISMSWPFEDSSCDDKVDNHSNTEQHQSEGKSLQVHVDNDSLGR